MRAANGVECGLLEDGRAADDVRAFDGSGARDDGFDDDGAFGAGEPGDGWVVGADGREEVAGPTRMCAAEGGAALIPAGTAGLVMPRLVMASGGASTGGPGGCRRSRKRLCGGWRGGGGGGAGEWPEMDRRWRRCGRTRRSEGGGEGAREGKGFGVEEREGEDDGGCDELRADGDERGPAVVGAKERGGFDERVLEHEGTSMGRRNSRPFSYRGASGEGCYPWC